MSALMVVVATESASPYKPNHRLFNGNTKTHSRPHVPNDNPYSEAQFKTLKYVTAAPSGG